MRHIRQLILVLGIQAMTFSKVFAQNNVLQSCAEDTCTLVLYDENYPVKRILLVKKSDPNMDIYRLRSNTNCYAVGYSDTSLITSFIFDFVHPFENGYAVVVKDSLQGIIDSTGKIIIPIKYRYLSNMKDGVSYYSKNGKNIEGLVNINKQEYPIEANAKEILIDDKTETTRSIPLKDGRLVENIFFKIPYEFSGGYGLIKRQVFSNQMKLLFTCPYEIFACKDGMFKICKMNDSLGYKQYGFVDSTGTLVVKPMYLSATDFSNGFATVTYGNPKSPITKRIDKKGLSVDVSK